MKNITFLEMLELHCELCRQRLFFDESECMFCQYFKAMEEIKQEYSDVCNNQQKN